MNARTQAIVDLVRLGLSPYMASLIAKELPAIQRGHEAACNWPEGIAGAFERRGGRAFTRVAKLLAASGCGLEAVEQCDPRGCCVEVHGAYHYAQHGSHGEPKARLCARGFTTRQIERIDRATVWP